MYRERLVLEPIEFGRRLSMTALANTTVVGIDLGATNIRAAVVRAGRVDRIASTRVDSTGSAEKVIDQISDVARRIWSDDVEAVGIGVPGVVDVETGVVFDVQNIPSMKEVPVKQVLEARLHRPTFVNNDVNCFALAECAFGKAQGRRSVAVINLGTGFAAGLVVNGALYEGWNCGAGEFGMIPYGDGVLEHYCSGLFFSRRGMDGGEVFSKAMDGDEEARSLWKEFGRHVGEAVKIVLFAVDPEIIVMGGSICRAYRLFETSMWASIREFAYGRSVERLTVELSELEQPGLLGAAVLAAQKL